MSKQAKILITLIVAFIIITIISGIVIDSENKKNSKDFERLLVRSLHAQGDIPEGFIKVFEDDESDRVFYLNPDAKGFYEQHAYVYIKDQPSKCLVVEQGDNYMLVRPVDLSRVYGGLSGSPVMSSERISIGFVSELTADGLIKVIANR